MVMEKLVIAGLAAAPGEVASGLAEVPGESVKLPFTIINGEKPGPTALVTAGVHSAEYVGIAAAAELWREIDPAELSGAVVLIRLMNPSGFERRTISMVYEDGKNLNRVFPGDKSGTASEKIAYTVFEDFIKKCDYFIDLHSGDSYESLATMVFCVGNAAPEVVAKAAVMAEACNVGYMVYSMLGTSGAYNCAGSFGVPSILIERGQMGRWSQKEVSLCKRDVFSVLAKLGMLPSSRFGGTPKPRLLTRTVHVPSPASGMWYPNFTAGDNFLAGQAIGLIKDYDGRVLASPAFEFSGVVLYQVESLTTIKGENLIAYGGV
jgi:predicted deacylase